MEMEMETETGPDESPMKMTGNYNAESITDVSGGTGGSFSPQLKRLRRASTDTTSSTDTTTTTALSADNDTANKNASDKDLWSTLIRQSHRYSQLKPNIETFEVDHKWLRCYAREALAYFEKKTGEFYRYEGPRSMCLCSLPDSEYKVTHINFFASPKGKFSESLFFAALEHGPVRKVVECCTVPLSKASDSVVPYIKHPKDVDCSECSKFGDAVLCFEVDEEYSIPWSSTLLSSAV